MFCFIDGCHDLSTEQLRMDRIAVESMKEKMSQIDNSIIITVCSGLSMGKLKRMQQFSH